MGAKGNVTPHAIWFEPDKDIPMAERHFEFNPENNWFKRVKDIFPR